MLQVTAWVCFVPSTFKGKISKIGVVAWSLQVDKVLREPWGLQGLLKGGGTEKHGEVSASHRGLLFMDNLDFGHIQSMQGG